MKAQNSKYKIVDKNKNKKSEKNIRLERKNQHGKKNAKKKDQRKSKQKQKKELVLKIKDEKIRKLMESDEKLTKENLKFIGDDETICAAIGIRLELYFNKSKLDNVEKRLANLIKDTSLDRMINLANDVNLIKKVIKQCEAHLQKEKEKKENQNENNNNSEKQGKERRKNEQLRHGIISGTRGMNFSESDDGDDEDDEDDDNNNHSIGRNGNEMGNASGNGNYDLNSVNNLNSQFGRGSMDIGADFGFEINGIQGANGNNNNNNNNNNNSNKQDATIGAQIASLQQKQKEKIGKMVDNESYINDNPSMGSH